ncbi:MAG: multidrug efflux RND transporter permease subunit [Syntrophales bacterium]
MISRFFIDRPLFACVLSAFILIAGLVSLYVLPVSLYPNILPPMIEVAANYPGATPEVISETVAAPLEQQINGTEGMMFIRSGSSANGACSVVATFAVGTNPDLAVINVQNRVQAALPQLPEAVRRQGVVVRKMNWTAVQYITVDSPDGRYSPSFISNYTMINIAEQLRRLPGIASVDAFGAREYAMRIWLYPDKLAQMNLTARDVARAINEQNAQFATGRIGDEPTSENVNLTMSITAQGRLSTPAEFEKIIIKSDSKGAVVHLKDVARVELGSKDFSVNTTQSGKFAACIGIFPQPGANVLEIGDRIIATLKELDDKFPPGLRWQIPWDTNWFVRVAIKEVVKTLLEAMCLVFLVVFLFLQNWRATLIPCLAVPVSLIGAMAGIYALGANINLATLFALVLSIGIVVDDAIVVLENVERHMRNEGLNAKEATQLAMQEVTKPVIAIVLVLTAVFLPVAFLGGLVGEMYRQFAIAISTSVIISGFVALTLTPALCALLLKPNSHTPTRLGEKYRLWFERMTLRYATGVGYLVRHGLLALGLVLCILAATYGLHRSIPTAMIPEEDQGYVVALPFLPPAASLKRTEAVMQQIENHFKNHPAILETVSFIGMDPYAWMPRTSSGYGFVTFKHWNERKDKALQSWSIVEEINALDGQIKDALVYGANPPPIEGLSTVGGFEGFVQSRVGTDYKALEAATAKLVEAAAARPELTGVLTSFTAQVPQVRLSVNREQAKLLGVDVDEVFDILQSTFGAYYVNDFNMLGRVYQVQMQSDEQYRTHLKDLGHVYMRSKNGRPIPLTAIASTEIITGPDIIERFNVFPAARIMGAPAPGYSSGQALEIMEKLARQHLPEGYKLAWAGQSFLEKETKKDTAWLYILAMLMVFLILAAQYESLTLPLAVIMSVPFAAFGAFAAVWTRGLYNDVYLQIGLVTLVGLAAKNAILIVEFAAHMEKEGIDLGKAAIEAARLRFRPILMTSMAFILGVLPLAISSGAGANSRHSIGTGVIGGMLAATFIATFFVPVFFVWVVKLGRKFNSIFSRRTHHIDNVS